MTRPDQALRNYAAAAFALILLLAAQCLNVRADDAAAEIRQALTQWTDDFNEERTDKVCDLFATDVRADVRGASERDHAAICDLLVRSLSDKTRRYRYSMHIKEVLVFGEVAVVRLIWTLYITEHDGTIIQSVEPGMDIFRKQADGSWKIIRYMAYERE